MGNARNRAAEDLSTLRRSRQYRVAVLSLRTAFLAFLSGFVWAGLVILTDWQWFAVPFLLSAAIAAIATLIAIVAFVPLNASGVRYIARGQSAREMGGRYLRGNVEFARDVFGIRRGR